MNKQQEALRLADEIDGNALESVAAICAAAELRRLHEVVQRLLRERNISLEAGQRDTARIAELEKQRNELLEALKLARLMLIAHGETHAKIDAAIAKAEGKQ